MKLPSSSFVTVVLTSLVFVTSYQASASATPARPTQDSAEARAHFALEETAGSRQVLGGPAEAVTATLHGGAALGVAGKSGTALQLNGANAYAATSAPVVDTTTSFSVAAWVKLDNLNANYTILSQAGAVNSGFQLYYSNYHDKWIFNRHTVDKDPTEIVRAMSDSAPKAGTWTHLVGSYDSDAKTLSLFVNGQLQQSAKFTTPWRARGGLQIGRLWYKTGWQEYAPGTIDEVQVVQSAVTAADAQTLRDGGRLPQHLQELATFPLDEKAGDVTLDGGRNAGAAAAVVGAGAQLGVPGQTGTALRLSGGDAYAATAEPVVDTARSFSVSAWAKLDDTDRNYTVLSQAGAVNSGFQLYYSHSFDAWVFNRHVSDAAGAAIVRAVSPDKAEKGVWTHLTGTYDAAAQQLKLYVDDTLRATAAFTTPWRAEGGLQLGRLRYEGGWHENFAGTIDDVRVEGERPATGHPCPSVIGHRGAPQLAPENTVASIEAAADHGADRVEVDVQLTKDGVPILMHDTTVDRTTNGSGRVDQLTAEQIAQLTVKGGGRVPTLAQALAALQNRTTDLLLEIKEEQSASEVKHILSVVDKAHMTDRTIVQSFHEDVVRDAEAASPDLRVGLLRSALDSDPVATARRFSLSMYAVKYGGLAAKPTAADALTKAGVQVFVWTINSENEWRNALTWGVDGIITDRPDLLHSWRATQCERR